MLQAKLTTILCALLLVGALPKEDPITLAVSLDGSWDMVSIASDGLTPTNLASEGVIWTFRDGKLTTTVNRSVRQLIPYNLDVSHRPARIKLAGLRGIFAIYGDSMQICFNVTGDNRWPADFSSSSQLELYRFKRRP